MDVPRLCGFASDDHERSCGRISSGCNAPLFRCGPATKVATYQGHHDHQGPDRKSGPSPRRLVVFGRHRSSSLRRCLVPPANRPLRIRTMRRRLDLLQRTTRINRRRQVDLPHRRAQRPLDCIRWFVGGLQPHGRPPPVGDAFIIPRAARGGNYSFGARRRAGGFGPGESSLGWLGSSPFDSTLSTLSASPSVASSVVG